MTVSCVVGMSYGDEGKGKISDFLGKDHDIGVRFNGSCNAGHTMVVDGKKYVSHLLPASAIRKGMVSVITAGVLIDTEVLKKDIETIGFAGNKIYVDGKCPVITKEHKRIDAGENSKRIGTTGRGVGPCMADQINRIGDRLISNGEISCVDTRDFLYTSIRRGSNVLFEGAQGTFLDLWHGTYPYVTSSPCTTGAVCTNAGIPPKMITDIYGVFKVYTTRVGEGPFLTEHTPKIAEKLREAGGEYGATTGRPRRTGWLDLIDLRTACEINGVDWLCMTKTDVMSIFSKFRVAVDRGLKGQPIYEDVPSWGKEVSAATSYKELPDGLKRFMALVERRIGRPVVIISNGPERDKTIKV